MKIKRIYDQPETEDGYRVLIDRLWPRGISKEKATIDEWNKEVTPSTELRKWFGHKPELFEKFKGLYKEELKTKKDELKRLKAIANKQNLTLLYGAKDPHINHAVILLEVLKKIK
ncbi:MAG: DUF488 domain-containing protein [Bacteroidetes bacterium]|nr:DUF488 domain-containing protein [Bacteroidota bacterium]MBS1541320.1 DUF488 domain-containing protein [Bacteroidota bacterium]